MGNAQCPQSFLQSSFNWTIGEGCQASESSPISMMFFRVLFFLNLFAIVIKEWAMLDVHKASYAQVTIEHSEKVAKLQKSHPSQWWSIESCFFLNLFAIVNKEWAMLDVHKASYAQVTIEQSEKVAKASESSPISMMIYRVLFFLNLSAIVIKEWSMLNVHKASYDQVTIEQSEKVAKLHKAHPSQWWSLESCFF